MKIELLKDIIDGYIENDAINLIENKYAIIMKNNIFIFCEDSDFEKIYKPMEKDKSVIGVEVLNKLDNDKSFNECVYYVNFSEDGILEIE